jgi:hypothetical protein
MWSSTGCARSGVEQKDRLTWERIKRLANDCKGKDRARQSAFERAQQQLQARGRVGAWDDNIWLVPRTKADEQ